MIAHKPRQPMVCEGALDGFENMRRDLALLAAAEMGDRGVRVYGWDGPWVSLGRFQSPERDLVDLEKARWVRRPTGGKAVLHGHDVTVGLAAPLAALPGVNPRSVIAVYRSVVRPIVQALNECGMNAALADATPYSNLGRRTADCFAYCSPNDIVDTVSGRKVCGCALRLTEKAVLVQASIPNGMPLLNPTDVIVNAVCATCSPWDDSSFCEALGRAISELA